MQRSQIWTDYGAEPDVALDHFSHTYDRAGNRLTRTNALHSAFSETYTYNDLNELTSSTRSDSFAQTWTLDALGNWLGFNDNGTSQTRTANTGNELTAISGSATPDHDLAGNMTSIPKPSNPASALTLKYDAWNRLVEVYDATMLVAKFAYDATGRRILKQSAAGFEHFFHSGQQVVETRLLVTDTDPGPADPKYQFVWSPRYVDALVCRDTYSGGTLQAASRLYYLNDANFNVTALVNASGAVVERYVYTPYGEVTIYTTDWSSTRSSSAYSNTTLYTGRELDPETGLYYYRARYYSAELGRFVGRDPIGAFAGDANLYRYVGNTPATRRDPSGLRDPASAWAYVPGAMNIQNVRLFHPRTVEGLFGRVVPAGPLASELNFSYTAVPDQFYATINGTKCPVCTKVGAIQIEFTRVETYMSANAAFPFWGIIGGVTDAWKIIAGTGKWNLDDNVPYRGWSINPTTQMGRRFGESHNFRDTPGSNFGYMTQHLERLRQDFEVHIVCLEGLEKGATYGGFIWGHEFIQNDHGYNASRWKIPSNRPNQIFRQIVAPRLGVNP